MALRASWCPIEYRANELFITVRGKSLHTKYNLFTVDPVQICSDAKLGGVLGIFVKWTRYVANAKPVMKASKPALCRSLALEVDDKLSSLDPFERASSEFAVFQSLFHFLLSLCERISSILWETVHFWPLAQCPWLAKFSQTPLFSEAPGLSAEFSMPHQRYWTHWKYLEIVSSSPSCNWTCGRFWEALIWLVICLESEKFGLIDEPFEMHFNALLTLSERHIPNRKICGV